MQRLANPPGRGPRHQDISRHSQYCRFWLYLAQIVRCCSHLFVLEHEGGGDTLWTSVLELHATQFHIVLLIIF